MPTYVYISLTLFQSWHGRDFPKTAILLSAFILQSFYAQSTLSFINHIIRIYSSPGKELILDIFDTISTPQSTSHYFYMDMSMHPSTAKYPR